MNQHMDAINTLGYYEHPSPLAAGSPHHLHAQQPTLDYSSSSTCSTPYPGMYSDPSAAPAVMPLTPTASPSLYDFENFKRKYSVDVGPFSFVSNSGDFQNYLESQDELFRRSSMCTDMSQTEYMPDHRCIGSYPSFLAPTSEMEDNTNRKNKATHEPTRARNTGDGPAVQHKHVCKYSFCGWSFKRYEHLKRHMLVHTGERPHVCHYPGCGKSFSRSDNFHAHCRTHNKKGGFQGSGGRRASRNKNAAAASKASPVLLSTAPKDPMIPQHIHSHQVRSMEFPAEPNYLGNFYEQGSPYQLNDNAAAYHCQPFSPSTMLDPESGFLPGNAPEYVQSFHGDDNMMLNPWVGLVADVSLNTSIVDSVTGEGSPVDAMPVTASTVDPTGTIAVASPQLKSHVCPVPLCHRHFKRLEHLKRHMRIHTLERPFSCTFLNCHKTFSRSDNLSQHMKTHQRHEDRRKRQQQQQQQQHQDMTCSSTSSTTSALSHSILSNSDHINWTVGMTSPVRC
ncbi:hypothetical protein BX666DRAFT_2112455 [Dichotomocladium elegans]|nr:hypothetical protein BX666DRAFT_2112455 [Dichotomocladium elegans]